MGMKRFLMIILSFIFLGGAVTGSALLLSGCDSVQTESGGGNSQDDILNDEENSENNEQNEENSGNQGENLGEVDDENPDYEDETSAKSINFSVQIRAYVPFSPDPISYYSLASFYVGDFDINWYEGDGGWGHGDAKDWGNNPSTSAAYGRSVTGGGSSDTSAGNLDYFSYSYGANVQRYARLSISAASNFVRWSVNTSSSFESSKQSTGASTVYIYGRGTSSTSRPTSSVGTTMSGTWYVKLRPQFTLDYDTDGGSSVSNKTFYGGQSVTLASAPTKTGYIFNGWTVKNNNATKVGMASAGESISWDDLYWNSMNDGSYTYDVIANWERISYTISYNANGGSGTMSPTTKYYGTNVTLRANSFTRTGYRFSGWATSSTGSVVYDDQDTYTANASDTLYAVWTRITYTITYNSNGGSGTMSSTTKYYGTSVTLRANTFTRTGYHFVGWALSSTGSVVYDNQDTYSTNASDTLYAKWSANTYYVNFNSNGGSGSMTRQTFTYGTYQSIKSNTFTRTGYTFTGWNRNSAGTSTSYSNGQSVRNLTTTNGGTVTLYAQWRVNVEAKYDSAGGYWYVENGKMPQTKVTSSSLITNINNSTTWGQTYYFAGQSVRAKTYGGTEYCQWNGNWYKVEPIRWRLTSNSSQTDGYATTTDTDAVLAKIVYVGPYSTSSLDAGEGYSSEPASMMTQYNGVSTSYLVQVTKSVEIFGDGSTFHNTTNSSHYVFTASESEINSVSGTTAIEFSDLAEDIIKYYGGTNVYFTRDLGSNYNNIVCFNGVGKETQRFATDYRGVQFVIRFTEYVCVA